MYTTLKRKTAISEVAAKILITLLDSSTIFREEQYLNYRKAHSHFSSFFFLHVQNRHYLYFRSEISSQFCQRCCIQRPRFSIGVKNFDD